MPKQCAHFWAGRFQTESLLGAFFEERYDDEDAPVSKFAESQGENWIDHDYLEIGFDDSDKTIQKKFHDHSYSSFWLDEFEQRIKSKGLTGINSMIMLNFENESPVETPDSFSGEGFDLQYLGIIEYEI